jgi:hypothetical protein
VGGIKISHLSHLDKRLEIALTVTRGKRATFTVDPLPDEPGAISKEAVAEFERRIAAAGSTKELDVIAKDLKAQDLGAHRADLLSIWSDRRAVITAPIAEADQ